MEDLLEKIIIDALLQTFKPGWVDPMNEHYGYLNEHGVVVVMPDKSEYLIRIQQTH